MELELGIAVHLHHVETMDDLADVDRARAGDEFQASEASKEVPNRKDEHPKEER